MVTVTVVAIRKRLRYMEFCDSKREVKSLLPQLNNFYVADGGAVYLQADEGALALEA